MNYAKYAQLLVHYCLSLQKGDTLLVRTTPIAEPLLQPLYAEALQAGAHPEFQLSFNDQDRLFFEHANADQLTRVPKTYELAVNTYDAILNIPAPYNLRSLQHIEETKKTTRAKAMAAIKKTFLARSAKGDLRWTLCNFPTTSGAQECGMSLLEYEAFISKACFLDFPDPAAKWRELSKKQQHWVNHLNTTSKIRFVGPKTDITFSTKGRTWINSDGKRNMPSGEVFTSPVEDSGNGTVYFSFPADHQGRDVEGVTLNVKDGVIESWHAEVGQDVMDEVFKIPGSRCFGEIAIGTNTNIQTPTKNILFDEKIGGSIHMAIGASYPETGGKNDSALHWDLITDMKTGSAIYVDDTQIYENGRFLI